MKLAVIQNRNGVTFMVRIVHMNDQYGHKFALNHTKTEPMVEFYDTRYKFDRLGDVFLGQFVSRYSLEQIRDTCGINLQGDVPDWRIDAYAAEQLKALFVMWEL